MLLSEQYAARMEAYAKANKRWQDRTGNARQGLFGYSIMRDQSPITRVAHTVDYGVYLELANQGRFPPSSCPRSGVSWLTTWKMPKG